MSISRVALICLAIASVSACNRKDTRLVGERLDPREAMTLALSGEDGAATAEVTDGSTMGGPRPIAVGGSVSNADWPQRGGSASHHVAPVALSGAPRLVWAADAGAGDSRKLRVVADPVVAGGRVFTLDSAETLTATGTGGGTAWSTSLVPASDRAGDAGGGGIAYGEGAVFAATGYGELVAVDAASGAIRWRQRVRHGAVGCADGRRRQGLYRRAQRHGDGGQRRQWQGAVADPRPAEGRRRLGRVLARGLGQDRGLPVSSGQLVAADAETGGVMWQAFVEGRRLGRAFASVPDFTADPVIVGDTVYVGTAAGRMETFDLKTGRQIWAAGEGAQSPVVVAGGSVFAVNDENQLVRLDAGSGEVIWRTDLPYFTRDKLTRRRDIFAHFGPVLAGGRLVIASTDGLLRSFDPESGRLVGQTAMKGGAASGPAVAGGTLYVLTRNGQLQAFR